MTKATLTRKAFNWSLLIVSGGQSTIIMVGKHGGMQAEWRERERKREREREKLDLV